jgi:hypothetical protein
MMEKLSEFLHVDLARLSLVGWLLMLASLATLVGGVALFAVATAAEGRATRPRCRAGSPTSAGWPRR